MPATPAPPFPRAVAAAIGIVALAAAVHVVLDVPGLVLLVGMPVMLYMVGYPVMRLLDRLRRDPPRRRGGLALWIFGLLYVIILVLPLYLHIAIAGRATIAKAQADVRTIESAIHMYSSHCGGLPPPGPTSTTDCTVASVPATGTVPNVLLLAQTNSSGVVVGPFLRSIPTPPPGWTGIAATYKYVTMGVDRFVVCARGEGTVASSIGDNQCP